MKIGGASCCRNCWRRGHRKEKSSFIAAASVAMPVAKSLTACGRKRNCPTYLFSKAAGKRGSRKRDEESAQRSTPNTELRSFAAEPIGCWRLGVGRWAFALNNAICLAKSGLHHRRNFHLRRRH